MVWEKEKLGTLHVRSESFIRPQDGEKLLICGFIVPMGQNTGLWPISEYYPFLLLLGDAVFAGSNYFTDVKLRQVRTDVRQCRFWRGTLDFETLVSAGSPTHLLNFQNRSPVNLWASINQILHPSEASSLADAKHRWSLWLMVHIHCRNRVNSSSWWDQLEREPP